MCSFFAFVLFCKAYLLRIESQVLALSGVYGSFGGLPSMHSKQVLDQVHACSLLVYVLSNLLSLHSKASACSMPLVSLLVFMH